VETVSELRLGYLYGFGAYLLWGFFPLYIRLLRPTGAVEILAHRVIWSAAFVALLLTAARNWRFLRSLARRPRVLGGIAFAAALIGVNWGAYIYGVNSERVVETSLGYFITPLVTVLLGVVALRERLRAMQWAAVAIGAGAVVVLTADYGRPPYIALILAASFGSYGLVKKRLGLPAAQGLLVESGVLTLPALAYLTWLTAHGDARFGDAGHTTLLVLAGAVTAVPLLLFAGAANRVPLIGLGILQYIAPILQLAIGVLIFHEPMPAARLAGFALVWAALVVFTADGIRSSRGRLRTAAQAATAEPAAANA
jgi:chloramphenicol-sensitive protein RarD